MTADTHTRADVEELANIVAECEPGDLTKAGLHQIEAMLRAYAATLPPQAAPGAEGKPDFEAIYERERLELLKRGTAVAAFGILSKAEQKMLERIWTAAAQKAALEAEARVAEMRDQYVRTLQALWDIEKKKNERDKKRGEEWEVNQSGHALYALSQALSHVRALPLPTGDRFMWLLEAAIFQHEMQPEHSTPKFREALSAFPQPEEER